MKAIFSGVTSSAAMIRSPSFSRERSSRTTMNSPFSVEERVVSQWCGWKIEMELDLRREEWNCKPEARNAREMSQWTYCRLQ